jgi:hypothetical protein
MQQEKRRSFVEETSLRCRDFAFGEKLAQNATSI